MHVGYPYSQAWWTHTMVVLCWKSGPYER